MANIFLFAGTSEGRFLVENIRGDKENKNNFYASVATSYGEELLGSQENNLEILCGRLTEEEMERIMVEKSIDFIIDTTHPYAEDVSANIRKTGEKVNIPVYRLKREEEEIPSDCIVVDSMEEGVDFLQEVEGNVLLTTGSKDLSKFTRIKDFSKRLYPRFLPMPEVLEQALDLGYKRSHIICMQGPFSYETNVGMLKQVNAKYVVTKESGKRGGFSEKAEAAREAGATLIVIGRPEEEQETSLKEIGKLCGLSLEEKDVTEDIVKRENFFPFFLPVNGKKIMVVGCGTIGKRRIQSLLPFSWKVHGLDREEKEIPGITFLHKSWEEEDLKGMDVVIAATDCEKTNEEICRKAKALGILVNRVDKKEDCDFYFPGLVIKPPVTVGITAQGKNHKKAKEVRKKIERILKDED